METLCDTSSVLLLIRIAPRMFIDLRFNCFTIREVWEEIYQTTRFKSRYTWRENFKQKIKTRPNISVKDDLKQCLEICKNLIEVGTINNRTNKLFDLGPKDQKIIANALAFESRLSTNDLNMGDFIKQEFEGECVSSLALLNEWLENGFIIWNSKHQEIIADWERNNEPIQPSNDIEKFENLTGYGYVGSKKNR